MTVAARSLGLQAAISFHGAASIKPSLHITLGVCSSPLLIFSEG